MAAGRSTGARPDAEPRRRDSSESRQCLLDAARALFGERGYERTTVREIGERAGVDPALIARYFGSKADLYLASLSTEQQDGPIPDLTDPARMAALLARVSNGGPGPILQAAVQPHEDATVQASARAALASRLIEPLEQRFADTERARLRAEMAVAAFAGIALGRSSGAFDVLGSADETDVLELIARVVDGLARP